MSIFGDNLRYLRKNRSISQPDLAEMLGYKSFTTVQKWEAGISEPPYKVAAQLALLFGVDIDRLVKEDLTDGGLYAPRVSEDVVTFDVLGGIAAGEYTHAGQMDAVMDKVDIPLHYLRGRPASDYFVLRVEGNSMYPLYMDGDLVLVLKTPTLQRSGQIGVIRHGEDATLKKVEFVMGEDWMKLIPLNPEYVPMTVSGADLEEWRVEGVPRLVIREINE